MGRHARDGWRRDSWQRAFQGSADWRAGRARWSSSRRTACRRIALPAIGLEFGYDRSRLQRTREVVLVGGFSLWGRGRLRRCGRSARESLAYRKRTQPLESPSAGCIFQNPDPARDRVPDGIPPSAGALVDRAGLKGLRVGGARVSPTHGNFIVNDGQATAERDPPAHRTVSNGCTGRSSASSCGTKSSIWGSDGHIASRRRTRAVGAHQRRGQQERGAAADCGVPADATAVRADERAAHPRRRRAAGSRCSALARGSRAAARRRCGSRASAIASDEPDPALVGKLRGSVLLLGPLLARCGSARLAPPGGDFPARRTIATHLEALRAMGAESVGRAGSRAARARTG